MNRRPTLSKDKSKLKAVLRQPPYAWAIELVAEGAAHSRARGVRTIFDDASVRFASLGSRRSGADAFNAFTEAIDDAFTAYPHAHTYVMCFDDKRHVVARKASVQAGRRAALGSSNGAVVEHYWSYDGASAVVNCTSHRPLPPWAAVRLDARAYRRALDDIVAGLLERYAPPAGRRLIVDSHGGVSVLETSTDLVDGAVRVLAPYADSVPKADIGEADITAQHYVARSRVDEPRRADVAARARDEPAVAVPDDARRRCFEAGDVLLATVDTDFIGLALAAHAASRDSACVRRTYVQLGTVYVLPDSDGAAPPRYCTRTTPDAERRTEIFDIERLARLACAEHDSRLDARDLAPLWSFVALCIACGNDYTRRLPGISHALMFRAYGLVRPRPLWLVERLEPWPRLNCRAFARLVRAAYFLKLPEARRPATWSTDDSVPDWSTLAAVYRGADGGTSTAPMPSPLETLRYYEQVAWSLVYAAAGTEGTAATPAALDVDALVADE